MTPERTRPPGWYPDPTRTGGVRWWNGSAFTDEPYPTEGTDAPPSDPPPQPPAQPQAARGRSSLIALYVVGGLVPLIGWGTAIYIGVAERCREIRRHAAGIGLVSLLTFGVYLSLFFSLGLSGVPSDRAVQLALANLLTNEGSQIVFPNEVLCAHTSGDQYTCLVHPDNPSATLTLSVTDDGHTISEVPYP